LRDKVDRTVIGAIGGIIGGLAFIAFLQLSGLFIKESYPKILHIAHLFIPAEQDHAFGGKVIAYIAHFTVAALLGVLYVNIFRLTGKDWATTKGLVFGAATWIIVYGIAGTLLRLPQSAGIAASFVLIGGHLVFGLFTSWGVLWLSEKVKL